MTLPDPIADFITRWQRSGAAERANFHQFAGEPCDLLGVDRPDPSVAEERHNSYVFEKNVPLPGGRRGRIDLYKRGCLVMEAKQGSDQIPAADPCGSRRRGTAIRGTAAWDTAMERARQQAQSYVRNLPPDEIPGGRPPLLVVVDVGDSIALYSEFTRTGGSYVPFPDPNRYRIRLDFAPVQFRAGHFHLFFRLLFRQRRGYRLTDHLITLRLLPLVYPAIAFFWRNKIPKFIRRQAMGIDVLFR